MVNADMNMEAIISAQRRIQELKADAQIEGYTVSESSERDLLRFLDEYVFTQRPFITVLDNGNLRALWKNEKGENLGIQFLGKDQVQYVFFAYRADQDFIARVSGRDSLTYIGRHIEALGLERLIS